MRYFFAVLALAFMGIAVAQPAFAQLHPYPAKPIRMILAFPPGGPTDINARGFAQKLSEQTGQQVLVDNRPGAGGNIGAAEAAKAAPDGYTVFYNTSAIAIAPSLYSKVPFDPLKDYAPVALTATVPLVLAVNPNLPVKSVQDFIAYAKANPNKLNYASSGSGTITHLAGALFVSQMGLQMQHIPYKGSAPALVDVVAGQVQMMIDTINTVAPYAKENRLRALGIAVTRRSALLPDVPTLEQAANLPGFEMSAWQGIVVPAGTPPEIVARLNAEVNKALQSADLRARLAAGGSEPLGGTSEQYAAYIRSELGRWAKVVRDSGAKLD
jgi:tripartite-type tricarboxylate transporter receptor subunit TctC